ncbi:MAG: hypothetical protein QXD83_04100 [Sulfolobales archaeon]
MRHSLALVLLLAVALSAVASTPTVEEVRDYYEDGLCSCTTSGFIANGLLVLFEPGGSVTGYAVYSSVLKQVEEVVVHVSLFVGNGSVASVWVTSSSNVIIEGVIDLMRQSLVRGLIVSVSNDEYVVGVSSVESLVWFTVLSRGRLEFSRYRSVDVYVARISEELSYVEVYVDGFKVFSSTRPHEMVPFFEPRSVFILGGSTRATEETAVDYTVITFNAFSSKLVRAPELKVEMLRLTPSVGVFLHNRTHLIVSYSCFYREKVGECGNYILLLSNAEDGSEIATIELTTDVAWEPISNVLVFTDYVNVSGVSAVDVFLLFNGSVIARGRINLPSTPILYQDEYTAFLAALIPVSIVAALSVKTSSMASVGLGLVGSGVITILLPWIGLTFSGVYALGLLLLMLGILVLALYRS